MALKSLIQKLVNTAITVNIDDLKSSVVFRSIAQSSYDPATGQTTKTSLDYPCYGLLTNLTQNDVPGQVIDVSSRKLLVPTLQLPGVAVDALDDHVLVDDVPWAIITVKQDPSVALYTFILKSREGGQIRGA